MELYDLFRNFPSTHLGNHGAQWCLLSTVDNLHLSDPLAAWKLAIIVIYGLPHPRNVLDVLDLAMSPFRFSKHESVKTLKSEIITILMLLSFARPWPEAVLVLRRFGGL